MTEPIVPAPAPSVDIGAALRRARANQGQTLDAVFQRTRIPKKFLEAIENNRFDEFPATVYFRGFLKSYCEYLDVDFEPLWNQIAPQKAVEPAPSGAASEAKAPDAAQEREYSAPPRARAEEPTSSAPWTPFQTPLVPSFIVFLVAVGGAVLWMTAQKSKPVPVVARPAPPPAAIAPIQPKEKMTLRVSFVRESWVQLHCDGVLRFEGRAPAGFTQKWTALRNFRLRTASPDDLSLDLNGREVKLAELHKDSSGDYAISHP